MELIVQARPVKTRPRVSILHRRDDEYVKAEYTNLAKTFARERARLAAQARRPLALTLVKA